MLVESATLAIRVFVTVIRHIIHPLVVKWMMDMKYYLFVLVDKSYIRECINLVDIFHLQSLHFYFCVSLSLNPNVTSTRVVQQKKC